MEEGLQKKMTTPGPVDPPGRVGPLSLWSYALLVGLCLAVYFLNLGGDRVLTSHEMDPAGGARQMISGGDWLIPRIGDHPWLEKPPLLHWLVASLMLLFGVTSEWVARLPSAVAGTGVVLLVAVIVGRWRGEKAGLLAGCIQCTSYYMIAYALLAEADMLLAFMVVSAIAVFVHLEGIGLPHTSRRPRLWAIVFWALIGLTNLAKGPMFGAAMVLMPCLIWLLWQRKMENWRRIWSPAGMALALLIALAWPLLAVSNEPAAFDLWLAHTFGRARGEIGFGKSWWYYLTTVPWQLLPWTAVTVIGAVPSLKKMVNDPHSADRFAWVWFLVPLLALSLSHGKHHHYLISCLPGVTLVTTVGILKLEALIEQRHRHALLAAWLCVFVGAPTAVAAGFTVGFYRSAYQVDACILGVVCGAGLLGAGLFVLKNRPARAFAATMLTIVLVVAQVYLHIIPAADNRREDRRFLMSVHEHVPPKAVVFTTGGPGIVRDIFYVKAPISGVWQPEDIGRHLGAEEVVYVVGRGHMAPRLATFGEVTVVSQSRYSHKEESQLDRYTLFRIHTRRP